MPGRHVVRLTGGDGLLAIVVAHDHLAFEDVAPVRALTALARKALEERSRIRSGRDCLERDDEVALLLHTRLEAVTRRHQRNLILRCVHSRCPPFCHQDEPTPFAAPADAIPARARTPLGLAKTSLSPVGGANGPRVTPPLSLRPSATPSAFATTSSRAGSPVSGPSPSTAWSSPKRARSMSRRPRVCGEGLRRRGRTRSGPHPRQ